MFPQIIASYVQTGQIRYVFHNYPLYTLHPWAQKAAEAAECAGEQGKYWEMHDALFGSQNQWSSSQNAVPVFKQLAGNLKVDQSKFDACLDEGRYADKVNTDAQKAAEAGIGSTPTFRINGVTVSGAQSFDKFKRAIDYVLAGGEPPSLEVDAGSFRSKGEADAEVVITEFSDFQ